MSGRVSRSWWWPFATSSSRRCPAPREIPTGYDFWTRIPVCENVLFGSVYSGAHNWGAIAWYWRLQSQYMSIDNRFSQASLYCKPWFSLHIYYMRLADKMHSTSIQSDNFINKQSLLCQMRRRRVNIWAWYHQQFFVELIDHTSLYQRWTLRFIYTQI